MEVVGAVLLHFRLQPHNSCSYLPAKTMEMCHPRCPRVQHLPPRSSVITHALSQPLLCLNETRGCDYYCEALDVINLRKRRVILHMGEVSVTGFRPDTLWQHVLSIVMGAFWTRFCSKCNQVVLMPEPRHGGLKRQRKGQRMQSARMLRWFSDRKPSRLTSSRLWWHLVSPWMWTPGPRIKVCGCRNWLRLFWDFIVV